MLRVSYSSRILLFTTICVCLLIGFSCSPASQQLTPAPVAQPEPIDPILLMGQQSVHHDAMGQLLVAVEDTISPAIPIRPMSVEDAQTHFLLPPGYQIEPVLTEPVIKEPAAIAFDGDGRMFVLELRTYMQDIDATDELKPLSRISMHEDLDDDGVYETHHIFVDSLIFPRFVMPFGKNSILSMESNEDEVYLFTDVDGDGQADKKELFTTNYGKSGNVEHQQSFLYWGMDNWLYSTYNNFRIRWTPNGIQKESTGSNRAQWGVTQDNEGKMWFQGGASGLPSYFQFPIVYGNFDIDEPYADGFKVPYGIAGVGDYQPGPILSREDGTLNQVTGSAGNDIVRGHRMPADLAGHYLYGEPVGRIVRRIEPVNTEGLTQLHNYYQADSSEFIRSTDPLFRPVDIASAPDGSVYIVDMYRGIIQQGNWVQNGTFLRAKVKQYELDKAFGHGRIWRITHKGTPRDATRPQMHSETPAQWVNHLAHPNGTWRDAAQRLLVLEQDKSVVPALEAMVRNSETPYAQYHALWTLEGLSALDADLVHTLLLDASPNMQIQALRVSESLYKKGDRSFDAMYERLAADENADVVIQAMLTMKVLDPSNKTEAIEQAMAANPAAGVQFVGDKILNPPNYGRRGGPQLSAVEQQRLEDGADIFNDLCVQCHGNNGTGMDVGNGQFMAPPLANSDHVYGHEDYVIKTLLHGISGPIDGISYPGGIMLGMPEQTDEWIASVASFIRTNLSNEAEMVTPESVARVRAATADKTTPYTYETLQASVPAPLRFDRDVWKVSASHTADSRVGGSASPIGALSFEGWSTGAPQVPGMWFQVEMPAPVSLAQIEFVSPSKWRGGGSDAPPPLETYPRAYSVQTSLDGETWSQPVAEGTGEHSDITIAFAPTKARFVRITQHATEDEAPWSMQELKLFGVEVAGPLQNE